MNHIWATSYVPWLWNRTIQNVKMVRSCTSPHNRTTADRADPARCYKGTGCLNDKFRRYNDSGGFADMQERALHCAPLLRYRVQTAPITANESHVLGRISHQTVRNRLRYTIIRARCNFSTKCAYKSDHSYHRRSKFCTYRRLILSVVEVL